MTRSAVGLLVLTLIGGSAQAQEARPLQWAADEEGGAPYVFRDGELRRVGFEVDLAEALARELGRPIVFKQYSFDSLIPGLSKEPREFDFAMNGLEVTPERRAQVRFSKPYYVYRQQLVVRADETRFKDFSSLRTVPGTVVGTMDGTAAERLLTELRVEHKGYPSPLEAYEDLQLGRLDAVLFDLPMAVAYAAANPQLRFAGRPFARGHYAIAFRPSDTVLAGQVDGGLKRLLEKGELQTILKTWGLWNEDQLELLGEHDLIPDHWIPSGDDDAPNAMHDVREGWSLLRYLPLLLEGAVVTVLLAVSSFALAMALGLVVALARLYGPRWLRALAIVYVEFFRGVPVLLLLFFLYFGLPTLSPHLALAPFPAALIGLGLNYSAYEAEIYRAGIQAVPAGQWEAAAALGMPKALTFRRIILPQSLRTILPPMTGDFVALFKDTSIASAIAVVELNKQYQILSKSSLKFLEIGFVTALLYLVLSVPLGHLSRWLEERWGQGV